VLLSSCYLPSPGTRDANSESVELVDFDSLYPPSPARDVMLNTCFGCHGANGDSLAQRAWHWRPDSEEDVHLLPISGTLELTSRR
jgi:hypothetical protein